ncbi:hypothetical protein M9Y10_015936 [Tritrichomonas musculus]|uniref:Serine-threonine/tyrosine-protein kinase catalytic domain-containing protein n=1 Tax=Tritrichomonas musculus TaxID=1915356 RepID=A0ABR2I564_9EUKA
MVVTDRIPYSELIDSEITDFEFARKIIDEDYRPTFEIDVKISIRKLIEQCWSKEPNERPTFEEIFNKLAFNDGNYIIDFYEGKETEDEYDINKYYLDEVDADKVLDYVEDMSQMINDLKNENEIQKKQIKELKKTNEKQSIEFKNLNNYSNSMDCLNKRIDELEKANEMQNNLITKLTIEKDLQQKQISNLQKTITVSGFNALPVVSQIDLLSKIKENNV